MSKNVIASVLGLSLLVGGFSATSGLASTEELVKTDKAFVESIEVDEVSPQFIPTILVASVGAKVVGAGVVGVAGAAGAWAFDKVTGTLSVQEELDYKVINQVFDR